MQNELRKAKGDASRKFLLLITWHDTIDCEERRGTQMIGDNTHAAGITLVFLATKILQLFNNWPQQADLEDVRTVD